jgi:Dna[CI] antecedent, DciA
VKRKKRLLRGIEPLGAVLDRANEILPPRAAPDARAPVSARDWEAAVGTRIAARAMPAKLDRGVLHVRVASSTWAQELSLLGEPILAQLRARGVVVDMLRFRVGRVEVPERSKTREDHVRTSPPAVALPPKLAEEVASVRDEELRAAIRHAAEKNLGWQLMNNRTNGSVETDVRREEPPSITPRPDARDPRFVERETDRPDRVVVTTSASPRRMRG